jgi:hypothetical protein
MLIVAFFATTPAKNSDMFLKYSINSFAHTNQIIWDIWSNTRNSISGYLVIGLFIQEEYQLSGSYQVFKEIINWRGSCEASYRRANILSNDKFSYGKFYLLNARVCLQQMFYDTLTATIAINIAITTIARWPNA